MNDDPRFYAMPLDTDNLADLVHDLGEMLRTEGSSIKHVLMGIVDEDDGGIIAYAIGEEHAIQIVTALSAEPYYPAKHDGE